MSCAQTGFAETMKLFSIFTTILLFAIVSKATYVDHEHDHDHEDVELYDEDWDDELDLEPVHHTFEKRGGRVKAPPAKPKGGCCDRLKFTTCNMFCGFSCRTPGCATCEFK
jgi:hypothetical protein